MGMDEKARLDAFEKMLHAIQENYQNTDQKMKRLKEEGKEKTATYRQLMGNKMQNEVSGERIKRYLENRRGNGTYQRLGFFSYPWQI